MTRCLRVRVGQAAYLVPSENVGTIALYRGGDAAGIGHRRVIDARRMGVGGGTVSSDRSDEAIAVEWIGRHGQTEGLVIVDEVEGLVDIDRSDIVGMPRSTDVLKVLFDGFWYDSARSAFLLHLRSEKPDSFAELRQFARTLAPLSAARGRRHVDG